MDGLCSCIYSRKEITLYLNISDVTEVHIEQSKRQHLSMHDLGQKGPRADSLEDASLCCVCVCECVSMPSAYTYTYTYTSIYHSIMTPQSSISNYITHIISILVINPFFFYKARSTVHTYSKPTYSTCRLFFFLRLSWHIFYMCNWNFWALL